VQSIGVLAVGACRRFEPLVSGIDPNQSRRDTVARIATTGTVPFGTAVESTPVVAQNRPTSVCPQCVEREHRERLHRYHGVVGQ
jgi:hypothetical protein